MDQDGEDVIHYKKPLVEMFEVVNQINFCVGFNTLGFVKGKITKLKESIYFTSENDGIYIKRKYYEENLKGKY
jgi:hypothetical protein